MAINPHDDYDALAKLLYPSIEASGNVYYGQTRKLTMDEVFDKNKNGFHSRIESKYNNNSNQYDTYFYWELGPLNGAIKVPDALQCIPLYFAKYELYVDTSTVNNTLNSGSYDTFEYSLQSVFNSIVRSYGKKPFSDDYWDGANFYINKEDNVWYIYIALKNKVEVDLSDYSFNPPEYTDGDEFAMVFSHVTSSESTNVTLKLSGSLAHTDVYQYFVINESTDWNPLVINTPIDLTNSGQDVTVKFRFRPGAIKSSQDTSNYLHLVITAPNTVTVSLSGDFRSLQSNKQQVAREEFVYFLINNDNIISASDCKFYSKNVDAFCYEGLFYNCTKLVNAPSALPSNIVGTSPYHNMFYSCRSLKNAPELPVLSRNEHYAYSSMFCNCDSLEKVQPIIISKSNLSGTFYKMFYGCTSLKNAPVLYCTADIESRSTFAETFYGCTSLLSTPTIIVIGKIHPDTYHSSKLCDAFKSTFEGCTSITDVNIFARLHFDFDDSSFSRRTLCENMFSGCTSLKRINLYMPQKYTSDGNHFTNWVLNVAEHGDFYYDTEYEHTLDISQKFPFGVNGIPSGWIKYNIYEHYTNNEYTGFLGTEFLITSGSNSSKNGRGDITKKSTLANMEKSFDESNTHQMNTYNADGSYNQEIWGYKSFNSPVQFRNGIYGEDWSIYTSNYGTSSQDDNNTVVIDSADICMTGDLHANTITANEIHTNFSTDYIKRCLYTYDTIYEYDSYNIPIGGIAMIRLWSWYGNRVDTPNRSNNIDCDVRISEDTSLPLTIRFHNNGVCKLSITNDNTYEYKINSSSEWTVLNDQPGNYSIPLKSFDCVSFRCAGTYSGNSDTKYVKFDFNTEGNVEAYGNIFSMINGSTYSTRRNYYNTDGLYNYAFYKMFYQCTHLVSMPNWPYVTVFGRSDHAFESMFDGCTALTYAMIYPYGIDYTASCKNMFNGCTSLKYVHGKSITISDSSESECYNQMFMGCTNLEQSPDVVYNGTASTAGNKVLNMFSGCTSLKRAVVMARSGDVTSGMFNGCSNAILWTTSGNTSSDVHSKYTVPVNDWDNYTDFYNRHESTTFFSSYGTQSEWTTTLKAGEDLYVGKHVNVFYGARRPVRIVAITIAEYSNLTGPWFFSQNSAEYVRALNTKDAIALDTRYAFRLLYNVKCDNTYNWPGTQPSPNDGGNIPVQRNQYCTEVQALAVRVR